MTLSIEQPIKRAPTCVANKTALMAPPITTMTQVYQYMLNLVFSLPETKDDKLVRYGPVIVALDLSAPTSYTANTYSTLII